MEARRKNARADVAGGDTAALHRLPSDVLELIFFRLPSLLHLVRAACACRQWRLVIADDCFLRNFRALRVPGLDVAGRYRVREHYHGLRPAGYDPMFIPSPSSPLKHDVDAGMGHFSLDFLPKRGGEPWEIADRRGFLYLLLNEASSYRFPDLVVCDPFTGKCRVIPPIADFHGCHCMGAFLLDGEETHGRVTLSGFRVLYTLYRYGVARTGVFSSGTGRWTVARCTADCGMELLPGPYDIFFAGQCTRFAHWITLEDMLLVLNKYTAEFSLFPLPADMGRWNHHGVRVVRRECGTVCFVSLINDKLSVFRQEVETAGWVLEAKVQLSDPPVGLPGFKKWHFTQPGKIVSVTKGRVVLFTAWKHGWLISLDLETMECKLAGDGGNQYGLLHPYELPWPPVRPCSPV